MGWWKSKSVRTAVEKLRVANEIIGTLYAKKVPHVEHFVFNSRLEVRNVNDDSPFKQLGSPCELEKALLKASDPRIYMTTSLEEKSVCFRVYTFGDVLAYNDALYGACVEKVVNATYASVGLDAPDGQADKLLAVKLRGDN